MTPFDLNTNLAELRLMAFIEPELLANQVYVALKTAFSDIIRSLLVNFDSVVTAKEFEEGLESLWIAILNGFQRLERNSFSESDLSVPKSRW